MLRRLESTPARLRLAMVAALVAGIGFGFAAFAGLTTRADAIDQSRTEMADVVRLQRIQSTLVVADAAAGVDVLLGPAQPRRTPHDYDVALAPALLTLPLAAAQGTDDEPLATANLGLSRYVAQMQVARDRASSGGSDARQRLLTAAELLRTDVRPRFRAVEASSRQRLADDRTTAGRGPLLLLAGSVLALAALLGAHAWITLRTRRLVNIGLAVGVLLVVASAAAAAVVVARSDREVAAVRDRSEQVVDPLAAAREAAFEARALEGQAVIARTVPSQESEATWRAAMTRAKAGLAQAGTEPSVTADTKTVAELLVTYEGVHRRLRDAAGRNDDARAIDIATSPAAEEGSVGSFEAVDALTGALLARQRQQVDDGLVRGGSGLRPAGWVCLAAGLAAAGFGWVGAHARLREYT